jgi:hypothetical protein
MAIDFGITLPCLGYSMKQLAAIAMHIKLELQRKLLTPTSTLHKTYALIINNPVQHTSFLYMGSALHGACIQYVVTGQPAIASSYLDASEHDSHQILFPPVLSTNQTVLRRTLIWKCKCK